MAIDLSNILNEITEDAVTDAAALKKLESEQKAALDATQSTKASVNRLSTPGLADQWGNTLSNTKDAASNYINKTAPVVAKAVTDTAKATGDYVTTNAPIAGKAISDTTNSWGKSLTDFSKGYATSNPTLSAIGSHVGDNLGMYGGAATVGLGALAVSKYLQRRRENRYSNEVG